MNQNISASTEEIAVFAFEAATEATEHLKVGVALAAAAMDALQAENLALREHYGAARAANSRLVAQSALLEGENVRLLGDNARLHGENAQLKSGSDALHSEIAALRDANSQLKSGADAMLSEVAVLRNDNLNLRSGADSLRSEIGHLKADNAALAEELKCIRIDNRDLQNHLNNLHFDLLAEDVPMLALKMAMQLTGAEVGLFTEADGDGVLARVGFEELANFLEEAVYDYSRRTAQSEEPTVENDAQKLPDGAGLVNLAALPFAAKGQMSGVLLLANKRSGPFTDAECQILLAIGQHAGLAIENAKLHQQLIEAYTSTVAVLADAIEAKDAYTRGHCEGVSRVSVEVARRLGVTDSALDAIRYAALLHDVGKIGIPDGILLKPGRLMPEEFSIIQKHAAIGRDLINRVPMLSHISDAILHHHEKFDGSGYPDGLDGENIPLAARIIGAVDAFDAMTSPRPYRDAIAPADAFAEMERCSGTHFDPRIVAIVTQVLRESDNDPNAVPDPDADPENAADFQKLSL